jgi:hypothetical protein
MNAFRLAGAAVGLATVLSVSAAGAASLQVDGGLVSQQSVFEDVPVNETNAPPRECPGAAPGAGGPPPCGVRPPASLEKGPPAGGIPGRGAGLAQSLRKIELIATHPGAAGVDQSSHRPESLSTPQEPQTGRQGPPASEAVADTPPVLTERSSDGQG